MREIGRQKDRETEKQRQRMKRRRNICIAERQETVASRNDIIDLMLDGMKHKDKMWDERERDIRKSETKTDNVIAERQETVATTLST